MSAYSYAQYVGTGTTNTYLVPFQYLNLNHVSVSINGIPYTDYDLISEQQVQLRDPPAVGSIVDIRRSTPASTRFVDFVNGSVLTEADLDLSALQLLYVAQEAHDYATNGIFTNVDGGLDAAGRRIKNVADPVDPSDTVTKQWAETATSSQVAKTAADRAAVEAIHSELNNLVPTMVRLPYLSDGFVTYLPATGELQFSLSEGPEGIEGRQGPVGNIGPVGVQGIQGSVGPQGSIGFTGNVGPTGTQGGQGITGVQGNRGEQGFRGPTGDRGVAGPQGVMGDKGFQGDVGPLGNQGPTGAVGSTPLGLAFGQFNVDSDGFLIAEYYGTANTNDFFIDIDGTLNVTV